MNDRDKEHLRVGFYIQHIAGAPGFERTVSAHVQIPLMAMELLRDEGHHVELITTEYGEGTRLPAFLPDGVPLHTVPYGSRQGARLVMFHGERPGVKPLKFLRQLATIRRLVRRRRLDVLHVCGGDGVAAIGGILKIFGVGVPVVATLNTGLGGGRFERLARAVVSRLDHVITSTEYMAQRCRSLGLRVSVLRNGVAKEMPGADEDAEPARRVLFWRDPSLDNGADTCIQVYERLAPMYKDVSFDLAVRPHWKGVDHLDELVRSHSNVNLFRAPYPSGMRVEDLIRDSCCIYLPFRKLSTHPQLAVLESMLASKAVVTTDIGSNRELIHDGVNGFLTHPDDVDRMAKSIQLLIESPDLARRMGRAAEASARRDWNWRNYGRELDAVYRRVLASSA